MALLGGSDDALQFLHDVLDLFKRLAFAKGMPGQHGDYYSSEYQDVEGIGADHPWEESRGMGRSYGFNRAENIDHYRTSKELVHELIDVVSRGGNLLLNVGPTADGRIPVIMQQRLRDIGSWLAVNGEAIYGTRAWDQAPEQARDLRFTRKGTDLYVHLLEWPEGDVTIDGVGGAGEPTVELVGYDGTVEWRVDGATLTFRPPVISPIEVPSPFAFVFKVTGAFD
jgi:alpha-L-fucosidase